MRRFVSCHPDYKQDSVVSPSIAYDLLMRCQGIGEGQILCPEVVGNFEVEKWVETHYARIILECNPHCFWYRIRKEDAYGKQLAGRLSHDQRGELVKKLIKRAQTPRPDHIARGKSRTGTFSFTDDTNLSTTSMTSNKSADFI